MFPLWPLGGAGEEAWCTQGGGEIGGGGGGGGRGGIRWCCSSARLRGGVDDDFVFVRHGGALLRTIIINGYVRCKRCRRGEAAAGVVESRSFSRPADRLHERRYGGRGRALSRGVVVLFILLARCFFFVR